MSGVPHVVVDGSNIATEGRSTPSLAQLEGAVAELRREMPDSEVIVVVDATFAHRIDPDERGRFEKAALRGEYVYPPAGAIGRGDAFLLRIAQKIDATVLSNDSFQEFHGEHDWLFERGRLLGATPVPGVGWIFVPRTPVRGAKSRIAVRDAERSKSKVEKAIAAATREAVEPDAPKGQRKGKKKASDAGASDGKGVGRQPRAVNDPLTFISFVAEHPLGVSLEGEVETFTSHGAVVRVGEMHCYVPLSGLGNPPPRSAREVLRKDERRTFVLTALDPQRRGVELSLPEVAVVSGRPSEETVEAELAMTKGRRRRRPAEEPAVAAAAVVAEVMAADVAEPAAGETPAIAAPAVGARAPAKAPSRRRKAAGAEPAPEPAPAVAVEEAPAEPQPPARSASRRRKQPAAAPPAATPEIEPAPAVKPAGGRRKAPAAVPPAPKPTRARRRPVASEPAAAAPEPEPEAVPAAKATRPRKRQPAAAAKPPEQPPAAAPRSRKRQPAAQPATEPPPAAPEPPPPAKAARSRKRAAPSTATASEAPPPPPEPAPPGKRPRQARSRAAV